MSTVTTVTLLSTITSFGPFLTGAAAVGTFYLAWRKQAADQRKFQARQIEFQAQSHRETHNLALFEKLASDNPRLQLAAASTLVERLRLAGRQKLSPAELAECRSIIRALISVTKDRPTARQLGRRLRRRKQHEEELAKFVGDHVARALGAVKKEESWNIDRIADLTARDFDWQGVRIRYAWWPSFDGAGVDFWRASLTNMGMRDARFKAVDPANPGKELQATLKEVDFTRSVLRNVDFSGLDIRGAIFEEADLRGAIFYRDPDARDAKPHAAAMDDDTSFERAIYSPTTRFPPDFDTTGLILKADPS